jgi:hypothetical protein
LPPSRPAGRHRGLYLVSDFFDRATVNGGDP